MIIVIFLVCIGITILGGWLWSIDAEMPGSTALFCGIAGGIISFIVLIA